MIAVTRPPAEDVAMGLAPVVALAGQVDDRAADPDLRVDHHPARPEVRPVELLGAEGLLVGLDRRQSIMADKAQCDGVEVPGDGVDMLSHAGSPRSQLPPLLPGRAAGRRRGRCRRGRRTRRTPHLRGVHWPHDLASGSYHRIQGSPGLGHHDVDEEARLGRTALGGRLISQMSLFAEQVEELT